MAARLKGPIIVDVRPSKIYPVAVNLLHVLVLVFIVINPSILLMKALVFLLVLSHFFYWRHFIRKVSQISQIQIDNSHCTLRIAGRRQQCSLDIDRAIPRLAIVLSLRPISPAGIKFKKIHLPIFKDAVNSEDWRLLSAYLNSERS